MKKITLSAKDELIEREREIANQRKSTLNPLFRDWLAGLVQQQDREAKWRELDVRLGYANSGGKFIREEMNER